MEERASGSVQQCQQHQRWRREQAAAFSSARRISSKGISSSLNVSATGRDFRTNQLSQSTLLPHNTLCLSAVTGASRRVPKAEQDRALVEAAIKVNPWCASLYPRISDAWKAVCDLVRPKFNCNGRHVRQRITFLLNRFESRRKQQREEGSEECREAWHQQARMKRNTRVTGEKPTDEEKPTEKDFPQKGEREGAEVSLEALMECAQDKRQREEDLIMEDWMKTMLKKQIRKVRQSQRRETETSEATLQRSAQPAADFVCPVCKQSFCAAEEQAAMIHFAGHLDERPNHCIECQQAFSSRHDFVQHLRVHVLKPSKYHRQQCDVCGEIFRGSMKAHLLKHGMNTYSMKTCSYCDYTTHKTSILNKHLRTHSGEKMFLCDLCPKSYTSAVYLKEHKLSVHERERKFYCHLCTKSFYTKLRLRRHIKTHGGDRPFKCEQCGRGFTTAYNMRTHQRLHTGVKPYQCKLCEAAFVQKTSLDCHMKKHGIVTQRRPQSCETGPDKQDQTDYLSKHQPQQYFEQVDNSGPPPPPPRKTPAAQSSAKEDLWPSGPGRQGAGEEHSQDETWPSQVPRVPVPQLLAPQLWARKAAGDPSRPEPWARKSFEESFRDDLWARKTAGESSRDDAWGAKSAPAPPRDALWGRTSMGESSKEVMWAGQQPSKPIVETSAGTAWASLATRKSSFREPPRVLPWPNLLGQRAHFTEPSLSSESGPQDFSFSMEQTFARAAESSEPTLPRAPVFPSQGSEADKQTLGSYSMVLHY